MTRLLCLVLLAFILPVQGSLINAGFEGNNGWTIYSNSDLTGSYINTWQSEGSQSFQFYRNTGSTSIGYYAQISQQIDMTGVTGFLFDCQDVGIDPLQLQFIIDDKIVAFYTNNGHTDGGTSWGSTATVYDIPIELQDEYIGMHTLTIRMQEIGSYSPSDAKYYRIDNLRVVPKLVAPRLHICCSPTGAVELCWTSITNFTCQVQYSPDLMTTNSWENLGSPVLGNGSTNYLTDADAAVQPQRFYRIIESP